MFAPVCCRSGPRPSGGDVAPQWARVHRMRRGLHARRDSPGGRRRSPDRRGMRVHHLSLAGGGGGDHRGTARADGRPGSRHRGADRGGGSGAQRRGRHGGLRAGAVGGACDDLIPCGGGRRSQLHPVHQRHHRPAQGRGPLAGRPGGRCRQHAGVRAARVRSLAGVSARGTPVARKRGQDPADDGVGWLQRGGSAVRSRADGRHHPGGARHPHISGADDHPSAAGGRP